MRQPVDQTLAAQALEEHRRRQRELGAEIAERVERVDRPLIAAYVGKTLERNPTAIAARLELAEGKPFDSVWRFRLDGLEFEARTHLVRRDDGSYGSTGVYLYVLARRGRIFPLREKRLVGSLADLGEALER